MLFELVLIDEMSASKRVIIEAPTPKGAINAYLNKTRDTRTYKIVAVQEVKPEISFDDKMFNVVGNLEEYSLQGVSCYKFDNKLAETIEVGGVSLQLGGMIGWETLLVKGMFGDENVI